MASLLNDEQARYDELTMDDYVVEATQAAVSAGKLAMKMINALDMGGNNDDALGVVSKGGIDLVTAVDKKCEEKLQKLTALKFTNWLFS